MDKQWYEISHTQERWTVVTWLLFAVMLCLFSYSLLYLTGFFDTWIEFLELSGKATFEVAKAEPGHAQQAGSATHFMIVVIGYTLLVIGGLVLLDLLNVWVRVVE